jgi:DNA-binding YbaB/EbfC family protein
MRGNIAQMMQQAQRMQDNLKRVQDELAVLEVTGSAGGGMVSVTLTGKMEVRRVHIDPSVLGDAEMLEDLVTAAMNDAGQQGQRGKQQAHVRRDRRHAAAAGNEAALLRRYE